MPNASRSTVITVEHHFTVPSGAVYSDLHLITHWANKRAAELGIDTSYDDWCSITTTEDSMSLVIKEKRSFDPIAGETVTAAELVERAKGLVKDGDESYNQALVDLAATTMVGTPDMALERAAHQILGTVATG